MHYKFDRTSFEALLAMMLVGGFNLLCIYLHMRKGSTESRPSSSRVSRGVFVCFVTVSSI